ncbi:uncharacterized protein LOC118743809 [Rhagoletis pomonella]|uniref:uncharacterized protein LOC118743809 n=1 Tax=Rhagoletis pomonella TaxID=28610 RepID=UPI00177E45A4|nr:uncharacterized protein LOC118743809 [Rhagoletis pomonella]
MAYLVRIRQQNRSSTKIEYSEHFRRQFQKQKNNIKEISKAHGRSLAAGGHENYPIYILETIWTQSEAGERCAQCAKHLNLIAESSGEFLNEADQPKTHMYTYMSRMD